MKTFVWFTFNDGKIVNTITYHSFILEKILVSKSLQIKAMIYNLTKQTFIRRNIVSKFKKKDSVEFLTHKVKIGESYQLLLLLVL